MILTEDAAKVTARKEDRTRSIVPLYARFFAVMRSDRADGHGLGTNKANASCFVAIDLIYSVIILDFIAIWTDPTQPRAKIAILQMSIGRRPFLRGFHGGEELVFWDMIIKEERRRQMEQPPPR